MEVIEILVEVDVVAAIVLVLAIVELVEEVDRVVVVL